MEVLRLPPNPVELELSGFDPNSNFVIGIFSDRNEVMQPEYFAKDDSLVLEKDNFFVVSSDGTGVIDLTLPPPFARYDREYVVNVYDNSEGVWSYDVLEGCYTGMYLAEPEDDLVFTENLRVYRPYLDIEEYADPSQLEKYINVERVARMMIDNITGGFYYKLQVIDLEGLGTDRLTVGDRANKLLRLDENNVTVYIKDCEDNCKHYKLNSDRNAIVPWYPKDQLFNRLDRRLPRQNFAGRNSDEHMGYYNYSTDVLRRRAHFPNGYNYTAYLECGWPFVPQDIQDCMKIIINDIVCGAPNYWSQYVEKYETKDFKLTFNSMRFDGTGNRLVDQTLNRYYGDQLFNNIRSL